MSSGMADVLKVVLRYDWECITLKANNYKILPLQTFCAFYNAAFVLVESMLVKCLTYCAYFYYTMAKEAPVTATFHQTAAYAHLI
jgi:hypothetical protein